MTTLYRTPNIIIDAHEWHATVRLRDGRISLAYRWRPLSARTYQWSNMGTWKGPRPKGLGDTFQVFRRHIRRAMASESARREAIARLRGPPSRAAVANGAARDGGRSKTLMRVAKPRGLDSRDLLIGMLNDSVGVG